MANLARHFGITSTFVALVSAATGGGFFRRLAGHDAINLEKADVKSMSVDIRRQQKTTCPRAPLQMAAFADVMVDGEKAGRASANPGNVKDKFSGRPEITPL